jgi:Uma2 family endonuclease
MTTLERSQSSTGTTEVDDLQRFVFRKADWAFYQEVGERLEGRRAFITYYKGKLEIVTTSLLHEAISGLLVVIIRVLAEETNTPLKGAGAATLDRVDLDEGTAPDASFYIANERRMRGKQTIDLATDPPPDLAIEVEVTRRLGERKSIYRDLGVAELWLYGAAGLAIQVYQNGQYIGSERSPTFPLLSPQEISAFVANGLTQDETEFAKAFRTRVKEALATTHQ